jgi:hypothetical protein
MSPPSNTAPDPSAIPSLDLGALGFDRGAHLLLDNALAPLPPGARLVVTGTDPTWRVHVGVWARTRGTGSR